MKPIFLFLFVTTMMSCTIHGQSSQHKENQLPDWAFGGFERPKNVNPVISPIENTKFYCPLTKDSIAWESNDTFNPAATTTERLLYYTVQKTNPESVSATVLPVSAMPLPPTAPILNEKKHLYSIPTLIHRKNWNGRVAAKILE